MSTRAGSATAALRAKQNLVRLLVSDVTTTSLANQSGPANLLSKPISSSIDAATAAVYTYCDLRTAYLQKVQELHPDKHYSNSNNHYPTSLSSTGSSTAGTSPARPPLQKSLFLQVQEAWKLYESFAKASNQCASSSWHKSGNTTNASTEQQHQVVFDANFTMFGVGCSFADNEQERQYRNYIMDQASRGYFTTGEIGYDDSATKQQPNEAAGICTTGSDNKTHQYHHSCPESATIQICNDDLFDESPNHKQGTTATPTSSLVSHLIPPHRRRAQSMTLKKAL